MERRRAVAAEEAATEAKKEKAAGLGGLSKQVH